jgi:tetratricopeptide (TPR) repeat protein
MIELFTIIVTIILLNTPIPESRLITLYAYVPDDDVYEEVVEPANQQLEAYKVRIERADGDDRADTADIHVVSRLGEVSSGVIMTLSKTPHFELHQSPILYEEYRRIIYFDYPDLDNETYTVEIDYLTAIALYSANQCNAANSYFTELATVDSQAYETRQQSYDFYRGTCALANEEIDLAATYFQKNYELSGDTLSFQTTANLAWIRFIQGDIETAFALLDNYIEPISNLPDMDNEPSYSTERELAVRAQFHALNNDFDAALADINTALDLYYDSVDSPFDVDPAILAPLFVQRGQIHLLLYEWDKVLEDYNTALQIDPDYADPYYYRGVLYYSVRFERENAIPDFERYLELAPEGELAEKAQQYLTDIQAELEALER